MDFVNDGEFQIDVVIWGGGVWDMVYFIEERKCGDIDLEVKDRVEVYDFVLDIIS